MQPTDKTENALRADPSPVAPKTPPKSAMMRYVVALVSLVLIVGGIAWVVQYLPNRVSKDKVVQRQEKKTLLFPRPLAQFYELVTKVTKDGEQRFPAPKEVEHGTHGHYDFLFKNVSDADIPIVGYASTCDCGSVKAALLTTEEFDRLNKIQAAKPGEPLPYEQEPAWVDLPKALGEAHVKSMLVLKPQEGGVARVVWHTNKTAGELKLHPHLLFRPVVGDIQTIAQELIVPVIVKPVIVFDPERVSTGVLTAGKSAQVKLDVWSCTRPKLDFKLATATPDPLFVFESTPFTEEEFKVKKEELLNNSLSRMQCAYHVTVTVHESKDGRFLDQGSFYRRTMFALDDVPGAGGDGPEIVGRVEGDIRIGGFEDQRKIIFAPFNLKVGATKEIHLETDAKMELRTLDQHIYQPAWVKVVLTPAEKQPSKTRRTWVLEVTVPKDAAGARSFEVPDAVVLRIVGTQDRFVRIPLEGHISR